MVLGPRLLAGLMQRVFCGLDQARLHYKVQTITQFIFGLVQCPLGFATLDKAAALGLATATPLTDLCQYINSDLGYSDLKIGILYSK